MILLMYRLIININNMDLKEYGKNYRKKSKKKLQEYHKKYYQEHKEEYAERDRKYSKIRNMDFRKGMEYKIKRNAYVKANYWKYKTQNLARKKVKRLVHDDRVKRITCQILNCNIKKTEFHHPDYTKPFEVYHLCDKHHKQAHNDNAILKNIKLFNYIGLLRKRGRKSNNS